MEIHESMSVQRKGQGRARPQLYCEVGEAHLVDAQCLSSLASFSLSPVVLPHQLQKLTLFPFLKCVVGKDLTSVFSPGCKWSWGSRLRPGTLMQWMLACIFNKPPWRAN